MGFKEKTIISICSGSFGDYASVVALCDDNRLYAFIENVWYKLPPVIDYETINPHLTKSTSVLKFSVRTENALMTAGIRTILQLVRKTEVELIELTNLGKKSLLEIKEILEKHGLYLGMKI